MYTTEVAIRCGIVDDFDEKTNERINLYTHARDADYHMRSIVHAERKLEVFPCHVLYVVPRSCVRHILPDEALERTCFLRM